MSVLKRRKWSNRQRLSLQNEDMQLLLRPGKEDGWLEDSRQAAGEGSRAVLRIVLLGSPRGGKSSAGNTILGRKAFQVGSWSRGECQGEATPWNDSDVLVVDTPPVFQSRQKMAASLPHIKCCISLSMPGPHALVLVTPVGRFTQEAAAPAKYMQDVFGVEAVRRMIILFTHGEELNGESLQDAVMRSKNKALLGLVQKCGSRICAFSHRAEGAERERQVSELMGLVQQVVRENRGGHYSSAVYSNSSLLEDDWELRSYMARNRRRRLDGALLSTCLCCDPPSDTDS